MSSDTGYVLLSWKSHGPVSLRLATSPEFSNAREVYSGAAHSYFLSGLPNGEYYLRLETGSGEISTPVTLTVLHQSLRRALWLVAIGLFVTLAIVAAILRGPRDE